MRRTALPQALHADHGFTLIEMLVALVLGVVVAGAALGILVVSQHQTAIVRDFGEATQSGRVAMTRIVDELHSSCIAKEFAPVQKESSATKLVLVNAYSKEAEIKSGEKTNGEATREDVISFSKEAGTLTDEVLASTGGESPKFVFQSPGTGKKLQIGSKISETKEGAEAVPVFAYYKYKETPEADGSTGASTSLERIKTIPVAGFSEAETKTIAGVGVAFTALPANGLETVGRSASMKSEVNLSFGSPNTEAKIEGGPCR
jgi:prepilin-type N-terminal cleavage/methylation domain-containing protein